MRQYKVTLYFGYKSVRLINASLAFGEIMLFSGSKKECELFIRK